MPRFDPALPLRVMAELDPAVPHCRHARTRSGHPSAWIRGSCPRMTRTKRRRAHGVGVNDRFALDAFRRNMPSMRVRQRSLRRRQLACFLDPDKTVIARLQRTNARGSIPAPAAQYVSASSRDGHSSRARRRRYSAAVFPSGSEAPHGAAGRALPARGRIELVGIGRPIVSGAPFRARGDDKRRGAGTARAKRNRRARQGRT